MEILFKYMSPMDIYHIMPGEMKIALNLSEEADIMLSKIKTQNYKAKHLFIFGFFEDMVAIDEVNGVPTAVKYDQIKAILGV